MAAAPIGSLAGMAGTATNVWTEHTLRALGEAGHRASAPREEVIDAIASLGCSVTAREIADVLRERGSGVGLASIYRALELLDRLRLVKRFDVGEGVARYEPGTRRASTTTTSSARAAAESSRSRTSPWSAPFTPCPTAWTSAWPHTT